MDNKLECVGEISDVHGVKWYIANFPSLNGGKLESCVSSPSFHMLAATWNLILFSSVQFGKVGLNREGQLGQIYNCSISLKRKCSMMDDQDVDVHYELELAANEDILNSFSGNVCFQANVEDFTKKSLCENCYMGALAPITTVKVLLNISPERSTIQRATYSENINSNLAGVDLLSSEIKKLYVEGQDCDFKIRVQTKEFSVHKAILAARSPVLYSMLHHDMVEKNTGIVDIVDFEPDIFNDFLLYLYSGRVDDLSSKNVTKLFALSDKYDLQQLKKMCREYMLHEIFADQFCDVVELAVKYGEKELLKCAEDFFAKNIKSILLTKQWQEFLDKNSTVCNELLIKFVSNPPPQKDN